MTEPHDLDRYLDEFGRRLDDAATAGRAPSPRRRRLVLVGAAAVATAGLAGSLLGTSGKHLDPVAEAQAALDPPGEIVHMRITSTFVAARANSVPPPQTTEQWTALDPPRWRFVQTLPPTRQGHGGILDARGPITGRQEFSYADGVQRTYNADRDALSVTRGYSNDGPAARVPSPLGAGSGDLQADLRSMLAGANVTDEGERQINGRTVRRLVSEQRSRLGSGTSTTRSKPASRSGLVRTLVYDVDPHTFAPIEGTLTITIPSRPHALRLTSKMHVDAYERIPLTATTARLLRIQTTPGTKVTVHTARQLRAQESDSTLERPDAARPTAAARASAPRGSARSSAPPRP